MSSEANGTQTITRGNAHTGERRHLLDRRRTLHDKKKAAKLGMTVSMGALVATGMMRGRSTKTLHFYSGIALLGFSFWHHRLYQPGSGRFDV